MEPYLRGEWDAQSAAAESLRSYGLAFECRQVAEKYPNSEYALYLLEIGASWLRRARILRRVSEELECDPPETGGEIPDGD